MRVVFMGTPDFSVPTLEKIIEKGHEVIGVVTQPDKPKGRGKTVVFPPVKEFAVKHNIPVYQPVKAREESFVEVLRQLNPDVIVVIAFGQILPKSILELPKYGCINVHASLLPKYRGSAPIQWVIIDGEEETGITTMFMDEGIDTGDMLLKAAVKIDEKETGGSLHDKLAAVGGDLLVETLDGLEQGIITRQKQDDSQSNYIKMLTKSMGDIDFTKSAVEIERLIRGLNPWPSAYSKYQGKTIKIWEADVLLDEYDGKPGEIVSILKDAILIKTGKGTLALKEIQLEGKKRMDVSSFLRGYQMDLGTVLGK